MADRGSGRRSIVWMILAPTPIIVAISLVVVAVLIPILVERKVNEVAKTTALEKVRQFRAVRELYTDDVVEKVLAHPDFEASPDHAKRANAIPSPATFIIELSRVLRREGIQMKLYSPFPFNNRFGRVLDDFGRRAWDQLEKDSSAVVTEQTEINGGRGLRIAVSDTMVRQSCVDCHNSHVLSSKRDWKIGDLRGVFEVTVDVEGLLGTGRDVSLLIIITFIISGALIVMIGVVIGRGIAGRLWRMRDTVEAVAEGRLDVEIPDTGADDEVGALGKALQVFRDNAKRRLELEAQQKEMTTRIRSQNTLLTDTNRAAERFLPKTFLKLLDKESVLNVGLGDYALRDMTILFSDIRDFTSLSEDMTPDDNFRFINNYLGRMGPIIRTHHGFIDKYIGDAIMALFDNADDAIDAALEMLERLEVYNQEERVCYGRVPIRIGIGINTGSLMLGTIGEADRMDGTVISDAVNLASRVEGLTKAYGATLVVTRNTVDQLSDQEKYQIRPLDQVAVKGKSQKVNVLEIIDGAPDDERAAKLETRETFIKAMAAMERGDMDKALELFSDCVAKAPDDRAARLHLEHCVAAQAGGS